MRSDDLIPFDSIRIGEGKAPEFLEAFWDNLVAGISLMYEGIFRGFGLLALWIICLLVIGEIWPKVTWLVVVLLLCFALIVGNGVRVALMTKRKRLARERHQACLARIAELEQAMNTSGVPGVVTFVGWDVERELARREAAAKRTLPYPGITAAEALNALSQLTMQRIYALESKMERRSPTAMERSNQHDLD